MTELSGISKFSIQRRINDAGMQFDCDFSNALQPDAFRTGNDIEITLNDPNTITGITQFKGKLQTIKRDELNSNKIFGLTGRHIGYFLLRQRFSWQCNFPTEGSTGILYNDYGPSTILHAIFQDTGIKIARDIPYAQINIPLWSFADAYYCGEFKTKKEAIDALFTQYARATYGSSYKSHKFVWYIDIDGYFKWFETTEPRGNITNVSHEHPQLDSLSIVEDNTNVVNYIEGYAGEKSTIYRSARAEASIAQHGLLQGETIVETGLNDGEDLLIALNASLDNTKDPLYTATARFNGLLYTEPGQKHQFPDSDAYSDVEFTIVDITINGTPDNHQTVINYSTDASVLSADNSFEIIKNIIEKTVETPQVVNVLYGTNGDKVGVQTATGGQLVAGSLGTLNDGDSALMVKTPTGYFAVGYNAGGGI